MRPSKIADCAVNAKEAIGAAGPRCLDHARKHRIGMLSIASKPASSNNIQRGRAPCPAGPVTSNQFAGWMVIALSHMRGKLHQFAISKQKQRKNVVHRTGQRNIEQATPSPRR